MWINLLFLSSFFLKSPREKWRPVRKQTRENLLLVLMNTGKERKLGVFRKHKQSPVH